MSLNPTGATYRNRGEIARKDRLLGDAIDDLASQIEQVRNQGNYGTTGPPAPPSPLSSIKVTANGGFGQIALTHINAPLGVHYIIEMSTTQNFTASTTSRIDNGISLTTPPMYLKNQILYFRAAPMFAASDLAEWTYFGGTASPTAVSF